MNSDLPQNFSFVALAANETTEFWRWTLERGVKARRQYLQENQVFDVDFDTFAKDPIDMIRAIYAKFNYQLPSAVEDKMRLYSQENALGRRFGKHNYNDALYFLNQKSVEVAFEFAKLSGRGP